MRSSRSRRTLRGPGRTPILPRRCRTAGRTCPTRGGVLSWGAPTAPDASATQPAACAHGQNDTGTVCLQPAPLRYVTGTATPVASPGNGYWEVAADGGIFNYGSAVFHGGSTGSAAP